MDLGPKFDLSDDEDEDEFDEDEQTKNCEFCPDFVLTHSNEVSIQEYIQEYVPGVVPLFVVKHVCRFLYLFDENPTQKKFAKFQVLEHWKKTILHSYHLRLLQIRGLIFSTLEGMMQCKKKLNSWSDEISVNKVVSRYK